MAEHSTRRDASRRIPASRRSTFRPEHLQDLIGYQLRRTQVAIFKEFTRLMARKRIAPGHFSILILIQLNPGRTQAWLARMCGLDRSTIALILQQLERRKLVERIRRANDKRAYQLRITATSERLIRDLGPRMQTYENRITRKLTKHECELLLRLLRMLESAA